VRGRARVACDVQRTGRHALPPWLAPERGLRIGPTFCRDPIPQPRRADTSFSDSASHAREAACDAADYTCGRCRLSRIYYHDINYLTPFDAI
jgi:hypothetical protein